MSILQEALDKLRVGPSRAEHMAEMVERRRTRESNRAAYMREYMRRERVRERSLWVGKLTWAVTRTQMLKEKFGPMVAIDVYREFERGQPVGGWKTTDEWCNR